VKGPGELRTSDCRQEDGAERYNPAKRLPKLYYQDAEASAQSSTFSLSVAPGEP
jgi:hypothetical protein